MDTARDSRNPLPVPLLAGAVAGLVHAAASCYWGLGGHWLVGTLGARLVTMLAPVGWLLVPVGLAKAAFAVAPVALARRGWLERWPARALCWLAVAVLVAWGGANTVVGNLVLAGVVHPSGGYDHAGMVGHAWLWDPLFLAWGLLLAAGLVQARSSHGSAAPSPGRMQLAVSLQN